MYRPPLPATTSPKHACRPEWDLTALAQLSVEQFHLRSFPQHFPTKRPGSKPDGCLLELPDRKFQAKSEANTPTPGEEHFTPELHATLHHKLHLSAGAKYSKQNAMPTERARNRNAAKPRMRRERPIIKTHGASGSLPPHQFSEGTRSLPRSIGLSAIFTARLEADMVNSARKTRFTLAFTHPFASKAMRSYTEYRGCPSYHDEFGREENTELGWSDPLLAKCLWPKDHTGRSSPRHSLHASISLLSRGREMRQEAKLSEIEVKEVRILLCTSVIATSSPSELLKTHVARKMRSENGAKVAGKKSRKWAGATPLFRLRAAQKVFRGRSRPLILRELHWDTAQD